MVIQDLGVKHGQEKNGFLGNLDQIHTHTLLIHEQSFNTFSASFNELQHFGQNEIQMRKKTGLVARINLSQQVNYLDRLRVNHLMNHLEDGFSKFEHGLWNWLDYHLDAHEQIFNEYGVILAHQFHQGRNEHLHEGKTVGLVFDDVDNSTQTNLVMIAQIPLNKHFEHVMDGHGRILFIFRQIEFVVVNQQFWASFYDHRRFTNSSLLLLASAHLSFSSVLIAQHLSKGVRGGDICVILRGLLSVCRQMKVVFSLHSRIVFVLLQNLRQQVQLFRCFFVVSLADDLLYEVWVNCAECSN